MRTHALMALAALALALLARGGAARPTFGLVRRSAHLRLANGPNETVSIRFGRVYEATAAGAPVAGHALPSLASLALDITNGTTDINGTEVNYYVLSVGNLSAIPNFQPTACPGGAAPLNNTVPISEASFYISVFYNASSDVLVPYGDGLIDLPVGGVKFNIDAGGWPFCAATNQLMVDIAMFTSRQQEDDAAVLTGDGNSTAAVSSNATISSPATNRRLLRADGTPGQQGGGAAHQQVSGGQQGSGRPQQGAGSGQQQGNGQGAGAGQQGGGGERGAAGREREIMRPAGAGVAAAVRALRNKTGRARAPGGREARLAAALISPSQAAALNLETIAYDAPENATQSYNVSIYMKPQKEEEAIEGGASVNATKLTLGFPAFNGTLHYDPTLSIESAADLGYTNATVVPAVSEDNATTTAPLPKNAAQPAARGAAASALLGGAAAAALLLAL